ncbi:MAG: GGDEF domain-containing protein [Oscillospiraceae bacterium]|nr:GGDEF domain-containing protein [Oscillospiraceae bacterium]
MSDYFIYYTESNIVCIIIFSIMLLHNLFSVDRQEKQIKYDYTLIAFMLYFLTDAIWASVIAGMLPKNRFAILAINFAIYVIMAAITYCWLEYVLAVEQYPHRNRPINKFAMLFPFLVSTITLIVTWLVSPGTLMNDALEPQPVFYLFLVCVPIINIVAVLFYSLRKALKEENPIEKRKNLYIGFFPIMVVLGGLTQIIFLPKTPIFCFCSTILMLIFFVQSMEVKISLDPLTGLNNRGQLVRYVSQKANLHVAGSLTYVIMLDVNDFKNVNDTYGHAEGDKALVIIADSLKEIVRKQNTPIFLGRFGGDEFIIIAHLKNEDALKELIREIREEIAAQCRAAGTPYQISTGIGYSELRPEQDSFQMCMQRADQNLYLDKERCKRLNQGSVCVV